MFNVLLQVLDDGRLTDGHGRTVDFKNCIVVMTSNVGSEHIADVVGDAEARSDVAAGLRAGRTVAADGSSADALSAADAEIEMRVKAELKRHFRPEFINRIDEVVIFHRLTRGDLRQIVDLQIALLQQRLAGTTAPATAGGSTNGGGSGSTGGPVSGGGSISMGGPGVSPGMTLTVTDAARDRLAAEGYDPVYGARPLKRLIRQAIENPLAKRIVAGDFTPGETIEVGATGDGFTFRKA